MRFKFISLMLLFFISQERINGQNNNIYVEFLGLGLLGSVNHEIMLVPDKAYIRASLGYLIFTEKDTFDIDYGTDNFIRDQTLTITPISLGANYLIGKKLKIEVGGGTTYWMTSLEGESTSIGFGSNENVNFKTSGNYFNFYSTIGLRYQNPKGGLNFRIGLSPIYINIEGIKATLNYPYLSLGVLF